MLIEIEKIERSELKKADQGLFVINDINSYPRSGLLACKQSDNGEVLIAIVDKENNYCEAITIPPKYANIIKTIEDDRGQMREEIKELSSKLDDSLKISKTLDNIIKLIKTIPDSEALYKKEILSKINKIDRKPEGSGKQSEMNTNITALLEMAKICLGKKREGE